MADYKQLYYHLFNRLTDLTEEIKHIQQEAEELFLQTEDKPSSDQSPDPL